MQRGRGFVSSSDTSLIDSLAALQRLDRVRRGAQERILEVEREIEAVERDVEAHRQALQAAESDAAAQDQLRRELEKVFEDEGAKMTERRMRLNRVRNEKELQALRHEIEVRKEANQQLEEQVIEALERLDVLNEQRTQAASALSEFEQLAQTRLENSRARLIELKAELDKDRQEREALRASLDASLLKRYETLLERRAGLAVVEVNGGTCQGCHRTLPPQLYIEIQRDPGRVQVCPVCHRILYWQPKPPASQG